MTRVLSLMTPDMIPTTVMITMYGLIVLAVMKVASFVCRDHKDQGM